jgi:chemotaxis response regulator CheB
VTKNDPLNDTQPGGRRAPLAALPTAASLVALGAGIGGPPAIQHILKPLRGAVPPIVIVQQLEPAYQRGFVAWLDDSTELEVRLAADGDELLPGHVYVAPHDGQLLLGSPARVVLLAETTPSQGKHRVDRLFESAAQHLGPRAVGIVLATAPEAFWPCVCVVRPPWPRRKTPAWWRACRELPSTPAPRE